MRKRRQPILSLVLYLSLTPLTARATEPVIDSLEIRPRASFDEHLRLDLGYRAYLAPTTEDTLRAITMRRLPPGSLLTRFDGFHSFAIKHVRSQFRRFVRHAMREGWYVQNDEAVPTRAVYEQVDHSWDDPQINGVWWQRSWMDSLPPDQGGAPATPYIHTYGEENSWRLGPFTLTNTLKLKFDYIAFFELNPDPVSHEHSKHQSPISLDVRSIHGTTFGTHFKFNIKPHIRVGLPEDGDWLSILRGISLRGTFEAEQGGHKVIDGEVEIKWRPDDGVVVTLELALARW